MQNLFKHHQLLSNRRHISTGAPKHSQTITDLTWHSVPSFSTFASHQLLIIFRFCCHCVLISSAEVPEHPWAAGAGWAEVLWRQVRGTSPGPCRCHGRLAAARVWASQPEGGSSESLLCPHTRSTLQTRSLPGDKQKLMRAALRSSEP